MFYPQQNNLTLTKQCIATKRDLPLQPQRSGTSCCKHFQVGGLRTAEASPTAVWFLFSNPSYIILGAEGAIPS